MTYSPLQEFESMRSLAEDTKRGDAPSFSPSLWVSVVLALLLCFAAMIFSAQVCRPSNKGEPMGFHTLVYYLTTIFLLVPGLVLFLEYLSIEDSQSPYTYFGPMRVLDYKVESSYDGSYRTYYGRLHVDWGNSWGCPEAPSRWCESWVTIPECTYCASQLANSCRFGGRDDAAECVRSLVMIPYFDDVDPNWPQYDLYGDCSSCSALDAVKFESDNPKAQKLRIWGIVLMGVGAAVYFVLLWAHVIRRCHRRKVSLLLEELSVLLSDDPWKDFIQVQGWNQCVSRDRQPRFHGLVADVLYDLWKDDATDRGDKDDEELRKAADEILRRFNVVRASKIVDAEFLADSDDPFDKAIRAYCLEHCNKDQLLSGFSGRRDEILRVLGLLEDGKVLDAMHTLVTWFGDAATDGMVANVAVEDEELREFATALAQTLWSEKDLFASMSRVQSVYKECLEEFPALYEAFCGFVSHPDTTSRFQDAAPIRRKYLLMTEVCQKSSSWSYLRSGRYTELVEKLK